MWPSFVSLHKGLYEDVHAEFTLVSTEQTAGLGAIGLPSSGYG